jgi:hypothetical protein
VLCVTTPARHGLMITLRLMALIAGFADLRGGRTHDELDC